MDAWRLWLYPPGRQTQGFPFENFGGGGQDSPPLGQVGGGGEIYTDFWWRKHNFTNLMF